MTDEPPATNWTAKMIKALGYSSLGDMFTRTEDTIRRAEQSEFTHIMDRMAKNGVRSQRPPPFKMDEATQSTPYGPMCRDPSKCAGKGYCPLDPTCGD